MAWIESHQSVLDHPKTRRLARALELKPAHAIGHLHALWHWAVDYAESGSLEKYEAADIADAARWEGDAEAFTSALVHAGFIDCDEYGTLTLHDWWDYAGKLIERRHADAKRKSASGKRPDPSGQGAPPAPTGNGHIKESVGTPAELQRNSSGNRTDSIRNSNSNQPLTVTNSNQSISGKAVVESSAQREEPPPPPPVDADIFQPIAAILEITLFEHGAERALQATLREFADEPDLLGEAVQAMGKAPAGLSAGERQSYYRKWLLNVRRDRQKTGQHLTVVLPQANLSRDEWAPINPSGNEAFDIAKEDCREQSYQRRSKCGPEPYTTVVASLTHVQQSGSHFTVTVQSEEHRRLLLKEWDNWLKHGLGFAGIKSPEITYQLPAQAGAA